MRDVPDQPAERVLVVIAHPDDAEFWAGGTVARWTDAGSQVTYCVLSDGEAGGFDPAIPRSEIRQARRAEQAEGLPLTPTGTAGAMVVRAPVITAALREYFELLWERATPLKASRAAAPGDRLTPAQQAVLELMAEGLHDDAIAHRLGISTTTVRRHVTAIIDRLGVRSRFAAGAAAQRRGWIG